jgi:hypothetical protein
MEKNRETTAPTEIRARHPKSEKGAPTSHKTAGEEIGRHSQQRVSDLADTIARTAHKTTGVLWHFSYYQASLNQISLEFYSH